MIKRLAALPVIFLVSLPAAAGNYRPDNGCTLDYPQSVLKNGSFKLDKEKGSGSESIALTPNIDLSVESGGCEYSTRTYRFSIVLTADENQTSGIEYVKAVELLAVLERRKELALDFSGARKALQSYMALVVEPKLGEQLYIRNDTENQSSEKVWIDADRGAEPARIAVTLSSGPY
ncbi:hypothetical protein ACDY96_12745 [Rhizobium mongolense]|uniref:hypothetical protein n=1 Tax=Rhizobium TaxID=379 RepID=UPI0024B08434|nr:hypothetical protein [Rhizobium sp. CC1099]WFU89113.1 hypothetical protein QA644_08770 [Rhizobium sp. CC1099]